MMISMNSANAAPAVPATAVAAADPAAAAQTGVPGVAAPGAADPALVAVPAALPFQQWLGLDQAAMPAEALPLALPEQAPVQPDDETDAPAEGAQAPASQGEPLLGAMAMSLPMMPAALPAMMMAMPGSPARQGAPAQELPDAAQPAAAPVPAAAAHGALPQGGALPVAELAAVLPARAAQAAQPVAVAADATATATAAASVRDSQPGAITLDAGSTGAAFGVGAANAPAAPARAEAPVTLAGPPAAWRQTLQEALGDRLQLHSNKNVDQAVIRLEPPMLGRIDISIRHAAGSLEVNISATHGEVLRQLNAVSDNLRSDLAQRQSGDVTVNVSQAPRAQSAQAGSQFGADAQGRGRQQGQEQERAPGQALFEAGKPESPFSLNARV